MEAYSWVEIGGVLLHGAPPDPGVPFRGLMHSTLTGWRGLSGARGSDDPIPGAHGSFEQSEILRSERSMALTGAAIGADPAEASAYLEQLESALADRVVPLRVCDDTGVWSRRIEVEAFQPAERWNRARVPFTIDMIAPDPARYRDPVFLGPIGLPVQEGGLILPAAFPWDFGTATRPVGVLVNDGTVPVLPRMVLQGAADAVTVHGGPRRLEFGTFTGELTFDSTERRAWLAGVDVTRDVIRRDWPVVPASVSADFFFVATNPSPDLTLTVEYQIGVR